MMMTREREEDVVVDDNITEWCSLLNILSFSVTAETIPVATEWRGFRQ